MRKKWVSVLAMSLMFFSLAVGISISKEKPKKEAPKIQAKQENPISMMTQAMADRLTSNLHVKNIVGDPVKVGKVTIIPIIMIDIGYGGGGGGSSMDKQAGGSGFYMSGVAKTLGFVVISKAGTRFLSAGKAPRK